MKITKAETILKYLQYYWGKYSRVYKMADKSCIIDLPDVWFDYNNVNNITFYSASGRSSNHKMKDILQNMKNIKFVFGDEIQSLMYKDQKKLCIL